MLENGEDVCSCKKTKCVRHGNCKACLDYHRQLKKLPLPYCKRPKKNVLKQLFGMKQDP